MSLCLTLHINLGLSLRKTSQALKDLYNIQISHQQIANYCKTAAVCVKPFVDQYSYRKGEAIVADETYIKVRGIKTYVWLIMNAACRSIIGYQVSDNRGVGPCILAMRMAFQGLKKLPENFKFIADGYKCLSTCRHGIRKEVWQRLYVPDHPGDRTYQRRCCVEGTPSVQTDRGTAEPDL